MEMTDKSTDEIVENWLLTKLDELQQNLNQCTTELLSQSLTCPKTFSIPYVDDRLKEFVRLHHIDIVRRVRNEIYKFRDDMTEKQLQDKLHSYSLTDNQVKTVVFILNQILPPFLCSRNNLLIHFLIFVKNNCKYLKK